MVEVILIIDYFGRLFLLMQEEYQKIKLELQLIIHLEILNLLKMIFQKLLQLDLGLDGHGYV